MKYARNMLEMCEKHAIFMTKGLIFASETRHYRVRNVPL